MRHTNDLRWKLFLFLLDCTLPLDYGYSVPFISVTMDHFCLLHVNTERDVSVSQALGTRYTEEQYKYALYNCE